MESSKKSIFIGLVLAFSGLNIKAATPTSTEIKKYGQCLQPASCPSFEYTKVNNPEFKINVYIGHSHYGDPCFFLSVAKEFGSSVIAVANAANNTLYLGGGGTNEYLSYVFVGQDCNGNWNNQSGNWSAGGGSTGAVTAVNNYNNNGDGNGLTAGQYTWSSFSENLYKYTNVSSNPTLVSTFPIKQDALNKIVVFQAYGPTQGNMTNAVGQLTIKNMIKGIIAQADNLGVETLIIPEISTGIFSNGVQSWIIAMLDGIQEAVAEQAANTKLTKLKNIYLSYHKKNDPNSGWNFDRAVAKAKAKVINS